jgi:hypothetical protein
MLQRVMNGKVSVREGDKTRRMTRFEALVQAQTLKAIKADPRSAGLILNLMSKTKLLGDEEDAIKTPSSNASPYDVSPNPVSELDLLLDGANEKLLSRDEQIELSNLIQIIDRRHFTALSATAFERFKHLLNRAKGKDPAG